MSTLQNLTRKHAAVFLVLLIQWTGVASFVPRASVVIGTKQSSVHPSSSLWADSGKFPEDDVEYTGSVDWDAEWKKVVAQQDQPNERPGKDFYKSEAEIAAIRAANKATESLQQAKAKSGINDISFNSLKGDWKFWIAILAIVSVGLSLISANGQSYPVNAGGDSYYI